MKPVHETLEAAKQFLYNPQTNPSGVRHICRALDVVFDAEFISATERDIAVETVMRGVHRIRHGVAYLRTAAIEASILPESCTSRDPQYVEFRDQWLNKLIEECKNGENRPSVGTAPVRE